MRMIVTEQPVGGWQGRGNRRFGWMGLALALALAGCQKGEDKAAAAAAEQPAAPAAAATTSAFANDAEKAAYSLGYVFGENVTRQFGSDIDLEAFVHGVRDRLTDTDSAIEDAEAQRVLGAFIEQRQAAAMAEASANLDKGLKFLEENGKREGVVTLDSGLQYEVLQAGKGDKPGPEAVVTTHYEGRLIDGTVFDSSRERGEPATFPLNRVIPGWTEGLQLMSPGAKYRLFVPAVLAYGERETGSIPANSTLIFDVELLKIEPAEASAAPTPTSTSTSTKDQD